MTSGTPVTSVSVVTFADSCLLSDVARQAACLPATVRHIVVAVVVAGEMETLAAALPDSEVIPLEAYSAAGGRNLGGDLAARGAHEPDDVIIFLDVDCLPGEDMVDRYRWALDAHPDAVVTGCGDLPAGTLLRADERGHERFRSLSFALTVDTWRHLRRTFGGFDKGYTGYGAEDTDFAQHLRVHQVPLFWVGGVEVHQQSHPVADPPWEHFHDILRNAERFHAIWGFWPMTGWLEKFADEGAVEFRDGRWVAVSSRQARVQTRSGAARPDLPPLRPVT